MTIETQLLSVLFAVVALCAIVAQAYTIRGLTRTLSNTNRYLTAAALVNHPSHQASIARRLIGEQEPRPAEEPDEVVPASDRGLTFAETGA